MLTFRFSGSNILRDPNVGPSSLSAGILRNSNVAVIPFCGMKMNFDILKTSDVAVHPFLIFLFFMGLELSRWNHPLE